MWQTQNIKYAYSEANLLPENHPENIQYDKFLKIFGEEANVMVVFSKSPKIFQIKTFQKWQKLTQKLEQFSEIDFTISLSNLKKLQKDTIQNKFVFTPFLKHKIYSQKQLDSLKNKLFQLPFYEDLLFNKKSNSLFTIVYIKKEIVNTKKRKAFILNVLNPLFENFEKENQIDLHISGMPYVRTMNSQNIKSEMGSFVLLALGATALVFLFFFKSIRATLITLSVVGLSVIWAFGWIGFLGYEITILTALIPPLLIVIGVPNAIFIINKYQQEIHKHANKTKALYRVIMKIGNATLMTNLTTSVGFATFIFTKSQLLNEFGIIASLNIACLFLISLILIPIIYSFMRVPNAKHLKHLQKKWIQNIVFWMEKTVQNRKKKIYGFSCLFLILSVLGFSKITISGSVIEDMAKGENFFKDIMVFEKEFGGIMPLEILVDTKREKGVFKLSTLEKIEELQQEIQKIPELSKPVSINNFIKYARQAFYGGEKSYYELPTKMEKPFIMKYFSNSQKGTTDFIKNMVDKSGRYIRITTYIKDVPTPKMKAIKKQLQSKINDLFSEKYEVSITGKSLIFLTGTTYLIKNLVFSLSLAIFLIALFMGYLFRSFKMIFISLIPNVLPLLITAGLMGYFGIPVKPSTILVFSISFGISVDDTIHFLAKYKQELKRNFGAIKPSVYGALRETGVSMFYTSIVLFFGFSVFLSSSFGGTKALGGLVAVTLLFAMVSNLILLPSLLLNFQKGKN